MPVSRRERAASVRAPRRAALPPVLTFRAFTTFRSYCVAALGFINAQRTFQRRLYGGRTATVALPVLPGRRRGVTPLRFRSTLRATIPSAAIAYDDCVAALLLFRLPSPAVAISRGSVAAAYTTTLVLVCAAVALHSYLPQR